MTHDDKINYMRIAAGIAGYGFTKVQIDMLVSIYELVIQAKGDATLECISKVELTVKERDDIRQRTELLDKVSTKV